MSIQLLTLSAQKNRYNGTAVTLSSFSNPRPFDEFRWNVIDLNSPYVWRSKQSTYHRIALEDELKIIGKLIKQAESGKTLVVLPQNLAFEYHYLPFTAYKYQKSIPLKEILPVVDAILAPLFPEDLGLYALKGTLYLKNEPYTADFALNGHQALLASEDGASRLVLCDDKLLASTIQLINYDGLLTLLDVSETLLTEKADPAPKKKTAEVALPEDLPAWLDDFAFGDDHALEQEIRQHEKAILQLKTALANNRVAKKMLVAAGANLAQLAVDALQEATDTPLTDIQYLDLEKGAFVFRWDDLRIIGLIASPDDAISAEDVQKLQRMQNAYRKKHHSPKKALRAFLIANPQRHLPPSDRKPFTVNVVKKATDADILIIPTASLMHLLNDVRHGKSNPEATRQLLADEQGVLRI